jgi:hypothetical protein
MESIHEKLPFAQAVNELVQLDNGQIGFVCHALERLKLAIGQLVERSFVFLMCIQEGLFDEFFQVSRQAVQISHWAVHDLF